MKALVLSGGKGTRLRPHTHTRAKQLMPVANRPIIHYVMDSVSGAGIKEVGVVIAPETGREIKDSLGDGGAWGVNIEYIIQDSPSGLAHAVKTAREFLKDSPFIMYLGDNLIGMQTKGLIKEFESENPDALILLKETEDPRMFGVVETGEHGEVLRLIEKPDNPSSNLALVGVYVFSPAIHKAIDGIEPSARGELEITDAIQGLVDDGRKVKGHMLRSWWLDTGKKDGILEANRVVLEDAIITDLRGSIDGESEVIGSVRLGSGSVIEKSVVKGPSVIGENTVIRMSVVGPYASIGNNCIIEDSSVESSVMLEESSIIGVKGLTKSLVGRRSRIRNGGFGRSLSVDMGDDSEVAV